MEEYSEDLGEISSGRTHGRATALLGYNGSASTNGQAAKAWLDVRVIYVRVSGCCCPLDDAPESLTVRFPPRGIVGTAFEVNGGRISPSEEALLVLRRDRVDTETAEATYVSTDNLRASGSVSYEVLNKDEALLNGTIQQQQQQQQSAEEEPPPPADAAANNSTKNLDWKMECNCVVGQSGCVFLKGRNDYPSMALTPPVIEVCVVGRFSGTPVILTQTVQMIARRRLNHRQITTLDAIPESEAVGRTATTSLMAVDQPQLVAGSNPFMDLTDKATTAFGYGLEGSGYGEPDGEMTWFNTGVRVGVGIGLGMCLGVGIGVGLMVRTYQATARTFRRGFF